MNCECCLPLCSTNVSGFSITVTGTVLYCSKNTGTILLSPCVEIHPASSRFLERTNLPCQNVEDRVPSKTSRPCFPHIQFYRTVFVLSLLPPLPVQLPSLRRGRRHPRYSLSLLYSSMCFPHLLCSPWYRRFDQMRTRVTCVSGNVRSEHVDD